jgi:predicted GNAT family acetyltransferase
LRDLEGWSCINVDPGIATQLAHIMAAVTGKEFRPYGDIYHVLDSVPPEPAHVPARRLTLADMDLLALAEVELARIGFRSFEELLAEGCIAGTILDGRLVATAHTTALTDRYADIGVATLAAYRNRGFATAAASLVARQVLQSGRTPVWSAGQDNHPSLRVAEKLGFREVSRRVYLIRD